MTQKQLHHLYTGILMSAMQVIFWLAFRNPTFQGYFSDNVLVTEGGYPIVSFILGIICYTWLASGYDTIDQRTPGTKRVKVGLFMICQILIGFTYLFEPLPHLLPTDYVMNGIKFLILMILEAYLLYRWSASERQVFNRLPLLYWPAILIYMVVFFLFRLFEYQVLKIYPGGRMTPAVSMIWSIVMGFAVAMSFLGLQRYLSRQRKKGKTLQFTFRIFAPMAVTFHAFFYIRYQVSLYHVLGRCVLDILAVLVATWLVVQFQVDDYEGVYEETDESVHHD